MASATRLPIKSIAFTTVLVLTAGASRVNISNLLTSTFTGPGRYSRIIAIAVVLANLKNFPLVWHFRVWNGILKHCLFSIPKYPSKSTKPTSLFLPVITTSHAPVTECDYNLHKSNSTYFADLDVSRSHLVCCLLQPGIEKLQHNAVHKLVVSPTDPAKPVRGRWGIMLGAVHCSFRREIAPYAAYEMWSRVLCYDRKWIYIVTHFVKAGTVRPKGYVLGDGSWFGSSSSGKQGPTAEELDQNAIFASAVSKYVVKLGRLTVHPEVLLAASDLLPPRPGGWATMDGVPAPEQVETESVQESEKEGETLGDGEWDWKRTVAMNEKGMEFANHFAALDGLTDEFTGSKEMALGRYRDFLL